MGEAGMDNGHGSGCSVQWSDTCQQFILATLPSALDGVLNVRFFMYHSAKYGNIKIVKPLRREPVTR